MPLEENEWPIGPDGLPSRDAARVILLNERQEVLLVRGHDFGAPERSWWFTVGGGLQPGEDARQAAVRECWEEAQICLRAADLVGPVIERDSIFYFFDRQRRQRELFFLAHSSSDKLSDDSWTPSEREVLDEMKWMTVEELITRSETERIYPKCLPALVGHWVKQGWDGECVKIDEYSSADPRRERA